MALFSPIYDTARPPQRWRAKGRSGRVVIVRSGLALSVGHWSDRRNASQRPTYVM